MQKSSIAASLSGKKGQYRQACLNIMYTNKPDANCNIAAVQNQQVAQLKHNHDRMV